MKSLQILLILILTQEGEAAAQTSLQRSQETLNPLKVIQTIQLPLLQPHDGVMGIGSKSTALQSSDPLKAYQLFLDRAAYTVFFQVPDPQLRDRLWQLYFDPTHYRYESQQQYEPSDFVVSAEKLGQASFIPASSLPEGAEPHLLVLSDPLKNLPTWSRFYRLQALLELSQLHQWVELLGSLKQAFSPQNFTVFEQANKAYSLWLRYELLRAAPKEALVKELIQAPAISTRLALEMITLMEQARSLSWEQFEKIGQTGSQHPHSEGLSQTLLKAVKAQTEDSVASDDLTWPQIQDFWLSHHHERLKEQIFSDSSMATYQSLRQKLQQLRQDQSPTPDFLFEKALVQALGALTPPLCAEVLQN